jgi:hypothetical protein
MDMTSIVLACVVAAAAAAAAAGPVPAPVIDESLRATLLQMGRDDQELSLRGTADTYGHLTNAEAIHEQEVHRRNGELIRKIVAEHGWPGRSLVGDDGARAAWIVVQHMDTELDFQRSCLALMEQAFAVGEVGPQEFAYLTDRVRSHEGRPQMYGTQGLGVLSAADEARVNANRAVIGLPPWSVTVEQRKKFYAAIDGKTAEKAP